MKNNYDSVTQSDCAKQIKNMRSGKTRPDNDVILNSSVNANVHLQDVTSMKYM